MRSRRVIYMIVFIVLLALAISYALRYVKMLNGLSGQK
jgi:hypothetical protein